MNPNTNGKVNHQKHFLVVREPRKIPDRLKAFSLSLPFEGEILFNFVLPTVYVGQCELRAQYG